MEVDPNEFRRHFSGLSDIALLDVKRDELVESAQTFYDEEVQKRGLTVTPPEATPDEKAQRGTDELVNVVEYEIVSEAGLAFEQLRREGIPAYLAIAVPPAYAKQAMALLDPGIPEDELAALAEGAAMPEDEPA